MHTSKAAQATPIHSWESLQAYIAREFPELDALRRAHLAEAFVFDTESPAFGADWGEFLVEAKDRCLARSVVDDEAVAS